MRHIASFSLLAFAAVLSPAGVLADSDHDQARAALVAGEILPLPAILERVAKSSPGSVLEIELDRRRGRWIYRLKMLKADGSLLRLAVDARDGTILKRKEEGD